MSVVVAYYGAVQVMSLWPFASQPTTSSESSQEEGSEEPETTEKTKEDDMPPKSDDFKAAADLGGLRAQVEELAGQLAASQKEQARANRGIQDIHELLKAQAAS